MIKTILNVIIIICTFISCVPKNNYPDYYSRTYVNRKPNYPEAFKKEQKAQILINENKNAEAIKLLTNILIKFPDYNHKYRIFTNRGILYHKLLKFNLAVSDYKNAIRIYPYYINAWVSLGLLYKHMGRTNDAKDVFTQCIEKFPEKKNEFKLLIKGLQGFTKVHFGQFGLVYEYRYEKIRFIIKPVKGYKIISTQNPFNPFMLKPKDKNKKHRVYLFIVDFSKLNRFRFLSFKKRAQRWANLEQTYFQKIIKKKIKLKNIKTFMFNNKKYAYVDVATPEKKYRMIFTFAKKFGLMLMLKSEYQNFKKNIPLIFKLIARIKII